MGGDCEHAGVNLNGARTNPGSRQIPASAILIGLYSDYLHAEYGDVGLADLAGAEHLELISVVQLRPEVAKVEAMLRG